MGVMVKYADKSILTYSLNAYMPWEGFRVAFNGSGEESRYRLLKHHM